MRNITRLLLVTILALGSAACYAQIEDQELKEVIISFEDVDTSSEDFSSSLDTGRHDNASVREPLQLRSGQFSKATEGLDFSDDVEKERKKKEKENRGGPWFNWGLDFSNLMQVLIIGLLFIIIAVGLYFTLQGPRNKRVQGVYDISIERIEEHLHETDLMRYLREALAQNDYAVAIRLYYLQMLKDLTASKHIKWSREKTNRAYLIELNSHPLYAKMKENTITYETVWFGKTSLNRALFNSIEPDFIAVLERTGTSLNGKV